tara:strand:+ start:454 stop:3096 length:2643 start_codon:yes stop_codon:yes gene_type:complete
VKPKHSDVLSLPDLFTKKLLGGVADGVVIEIPPYQRDLAWEYKKMRNLWTDMFTHAMKVKDGKKDGYFLGNITINRDNTDYHLVDGQQRLTTIFVIASAIRDGLISSDKQKEALKIQEKILSIGKTGGGIGPRLLPIEFTTNYSLCGRKKLEPYHKIIADVDTGLEIDGDQTLPASTITSLKIRGTPVWTYPKESGLKVLIVRKTGEVEKDITVTWEMPSKMDAGSTMASQHDFDASEKIELLDGDKIFIHNQVTGLDVDVERNDNEYDEDNNTMFGESLRMLYIRVRSDAEHYLLGKKEYCSSKKIKGTKNARWRKFEQTNWRVLPHPHARISQLKFSGGGIWEVDEEDGFDGRNQENPGVESGLLLNGKLKGTTVVNKNETMELEFHPILKPEHTSPKDITESLTNLLNSLSFAVVSFDGSSEHAIRFFLNVNDPAKNTPLETYDLVNGLVHQISKPGDAIQKHWKKVQKYIYFGHAKNPKNAADFFYYWLLASNKSRRNGDRWNITETYEGIEEHWKDSEKLYSKGGDYDTVYLEKQFKEMEVYAKIHDQINHPKNYSPSTDKGIKEKQYLYILTNLGGGDSFKQWKAIYMALRYNLSKFKIKNAEQIQRWFLHLSCTLLIKYHLWGKWLPQPPKGDVHCVYCLPTDPEHSKSRISSKEFYGILGTCTKAIEKGISKSDKGKKIDKFKDRFIDVENKYRGLANVKERKAGKTGTVGKVLYYNKGKTVKIHLERFGLNNVDLGLLMAFESTELGTTDPPDEWSKCEIEHILPEKPKNWGIPWHKGKKTPAHTEHVQLLGNKLMLEEKINSHVSNMAFKGKKTEADCSLSCGDNGKHYKGSKITVAKDFASKTGDWTGAKILTRSKKMADAIRAEFADF